VKAVALLLALALLAGDVFAQTRNANSN